MTRFLVVESKARSIVADEPGAPGKLDPIEFDEFDYRLTGANARVQHSAVST